MLTLIALAIDGNHVRRLEPVHQALIRTVSLPRRHRAGRLFGRPTGIVAPAAIQLVGATEAIG